jgi:prolyl-tRNA synthetase
VLDRINRIIREEMDATGAQELTMTVLQNKDTWTATGRWDSGRDVMYQFKDARGSETGLGWTHEEPLTEVALHHISSYKDLPKAVYQIQTKFRNEPRAKSGILRGREFLMKDLYSFHATQESLDEYYERVAQAYANVFSRIGLPALRTKASGGLFSKYSDEYQVLPTSRRFRVFTDDGRA